MLARRVFITVAETSGDNNAASLVTALRSLDPAIQVEGLGGPKMAAAGVKIHFETTARAAMTLHALGRAREVWRWLKWMKAEYARAKPDLHICVDSSGFNLHFAKVAKSFGVPVLYYVAPQLWASREGRIKKVRAYVDRLASIFPFEAKWYQDRGVNAQFVGHPLFDSLPANRLELSATPPRFPDRPPVIGIVPGSRKSEVRANLDPLIHVAYAIAAQVPVAEFLIPTTVSAHTEVMIGTMMRTRTDVEVDERSFLCESPQSTEQGKRVVRFRGEVDAFEKFIPQCDLVITKSGTSTVHIAGYGVPMIVVYRINRFAWHLVGRWLVKTKKIAMVNILAGQTDLVPEFIPWYGGVDTIADCAIELLRSPEKLADQRRKLIELIDPISKPGASLNVAKIAMEMMK